MDRQGFACPAPSIDSHRFEQRCCVYLRSSPLSTMMDRELKKDKRACTVATRSVFNNRQSCSQEKRQRSRFCLMVLDCDGFGQETAAFLFTGTILSSFLTHFKFSTLATLRHLPYISIQHLYNDLSYDCSTIRRCLHCCGSHGESESLGRLSVVSRVSSPSRRRFVCFFVFVVVVVVVV